MNIALVPAAARRAAFTLFVVIVQAVSQTAGATTVAQMTFAEICDRSDLIVEGTVLGAESYVDPATGRIATNVRIAITERLKGRGAEPEVTLRFAGGSVGALTMTVADMRIPAVGETGIYFVESLGRRQVHPLVGWSQGHFVERRDAVAGRPGMFTPGGRRLLGIGPDAPLMRERALLSGTGAVMEAELETSGPGSQAAMSPAEFKDRVRRRVATAKSAR